VQGLFLEDPRLLRWARLPVARQVSPWGGGVDPARLEAQLQALAAQAQAELEPAARRLGVAWQAQVLRGELGRALNEWAAQEDLWVIGTAGRVMGLAVPTPAALRLALPQGARWVLLQPRGAPFRHPMVVLHPQAHNPEALLEAFEAQFRIWYAAPPAQLIPVFLQRLWRKGTFLIGETQVIGEIIDWEPEGWLTIDTPEGRHRFAAAQVQVAWPPPFSS
jgi:hypothetical protein